MLGEKEIGESVGIADSEYGVCPSHLSHRAELEKGEKKTMETIKDIVAEMRKDMPRVVDAKVILRNYADRIEQAVTNFNQFKMREALERLREWAQMDLNENAFIADSSGKYMKFIKGTIEIANAAERAAATCFTLSERELEIQKRLG